VTPGDGGGGGGCNNNNNNLFFEGPVFLCVSQSLHCPVSVCFFVSGLVSPSRQPKTNSTVVVVVVAAAVAVVVVVARAFITTLLQSYYHTNCSVSGVSLQLSRPDKKGEEGKKTNKHF
jgi:hypothetical protein